MARRLAVRVVTLVVTVIGVAVLAFVVQFVIPGDPARALAPRSANPASLVHIREQLHLNDPLWAQFRQYFAGLVYGDLGESYVQRQPVSSLIAQRLPATAWLALAGVVVEFLIGMALGLCAALSRSGRRIVPVVSLTLLSVPPFVLGLLLLLVFGFQLGIAPVLAGGGPSQLVLPALTLGLVGVPYYAQIVSEEMTQALASPYVRSGVAKGLSNRRIVVRHTLRNVASPVITIVGIDLGQYLSGVVVVEAVFGWPGIGQLAVQSLEALDRPVVLGVAIVAALAVGVFNFIADLVRMLVDPRTRQQRT